MPKIVESESGAGGACIYKLADKMEISFQIDIFSIKIQTVAWEDSLAFVP
jgi:hypothetical protein